MSRFVRQHTASVEDTQGGALRLVGLRTNDVNGARLGRVKAVIVDRESGAVNWLQLKLAGIRPEHLAIPVHQLTAGAGHLHLPYERSFVLSGPRIPSDGALTVRLEQQLLELYDVEIPQDEQPSAWERRASGSRLVQVGVWEPAPRSATPQYA